MNVNNNAKYYRSCRTKKKYDKSGAYQRVRTLWAKEVYTKPYKCSICDGWHITRMPAQKRLEMAFAAIGGE